MRHVAQDHKQSMHGTQILAKLTSVLISKAWEHSEATCNIVLEFSTRVPYESNLGISSL